MGKKGLQAGGKAPGFSLPASNGKQVSLADYEDQPVIVVFLRGTW